VIEFMRYIVDPIMLTEFSIASLLTWWLALLLGSVTPLGEA